jgi:NAD-dependent dihydropyrimidine dehydrogenase PreA subunit
MRALRREIRKGSRRCFDGFRRAEEEYGMTELKQDRGKLRVSVEECKGCGLCVEACPPKVISLSERLNRYGYPTATYAGTGCTGCGICFLACPEPGAITVLRLVPRTGAEARGVVTGMMGASECASN